MHGHGRARLHNDHRLLLLLRVLRGVAGLGLRVTWLLLVLRLRGVLRLAVCGLGVLLLGVGLLGVGLLGICGAKSGES